MIQFLITDLTRPPGGFFFIHIDPQLGEAMENDGVLEEGDALTLSELK